jgi:uncharacterized protein with von Willebrand factor type A (vWA) domain
MASSPSRFAPDSIERRLEPLDSLPRGVWLPAIVNNEGDPIERVAAVADWYCRLLAGHLPAASAGLPADVAAAFAAAFARLHVAPLCRGQPAVVEQVLRIALWHVDRVARLCARLPRREALAASVAAFEAEWVERGEELREVQRLFESLDGFADFARWSEVRGLLRSDAWQRLLECRALIEHMPRLAQMIRELGRGRAADRPIEQPVPRAASAGDDTFVRRPEDVELPGTPIEIEGVRRSGSLAQLLIGEVAWASRRIDPGRARRLKRLFAARLAEQALLTFQHRDRWTEWRWQRAPGLARDERTLEVPRLEAGPIVVCIDTSASMQGGPERVAKAILLELVRTAARERRRCHVYAFSGAGQVEEFALEADFDGLQRLAAFVTGSFHGGTDVAEPLERALARVGGDGWRQADLLIASDGEFGPTPATIAAVAAARSELGLRVQGVLIGDRETRGMRAVVDDLFWVRDWRRYGGRHGQHDSPVHDSRLTRLYFPNMASEPGSAAQPAGRDPPAAGDRR